MDTQVAQQPQQQATLVQVPQGAVMVPQYTMVPAHPGQQVMQYQTQPQQQVVYQYQQQPTGGEQLVQMQQVPQQNMMVQVPQQQMVMQQAPQQQVQVVKVDAAGQPLAVAPAAAPQVAQPSPPPTPDTSIPAPPPASNSTAAPTAAVAIPPAPSAAASVVTSPVQSPAHSPQNITVQSHPVMLGSPHEGEVASPAPAQVVQAEVTGIVEPQGNQLPELPPGPAPAPHAGFMALASSMNAPEPEPKAEQKVTSPAATQEAAPAAPASNTGSQPLTGGNGHSHQRSESVIVHDSQPATPLTQMQGVSSASLSTLGGAPQTPTGGHQQGPYGQHAPPPYGMYPPHMQYPGPYPPHHGYNNYPHAPYGGPGGPQGSYPGGPPGYHHHSMSFGGRDYGEDRVEEDAPRKRHGKSSSHYKVESVLSSDMEEEEAAPKAAGGLTAKELDRTGSSVKSLLARCKRWSVDLGSMVTELESLQVEHLLAEIKELKETVEQRDASITTLTEERNKANSDNEEKDKEIEHLREQVDRLKRTNEDLSRGVTAKSGIIDKLRGEYELLLNELEVKEQTLQQVTKAAAEESEESRKQRVLHTALVELSPSSFDRSFCKIVEVFYTNPMLLCSLVDNIFEVAMTDFTAMELNAEIISKLMGVLPEFDDPDAQDPNATKLTFQRFLMAKCQEEIEQGFKAMDVVGPKNYEPQLTQHAHEAYMRALTMVQFLGCVFKMGALPESIIHKVIVKVLSVDLPRPQEVECICRLFITVGPTLSSMPKARPLMEAYFGQIETFTRNHQLNPRLRLQLLDLIDLRSNNWVLRNGVSAAR